MLDTSFCFLFPAKLILQNTYIYEKILIFFHYHLNLFICCKTKLKIKFVLDRMIFFAEWFFLPNQFFLIEWFFLLREAVSWRCSVKQVFLEISQNSQDNFYARVSFWIKLQASACNFIKRDSGTGVWWPRAEIYIFFNFMLWLILFCFVFFTFLFF